jgi:LDH2 family malate/lactate/ureidoglycolate dehydrogenase
VNRNADAVGSGPILLDFATSAIAQDKVRVVSNTGKLTPPGALMDHAGQPTTHPGVLFEPVDARIGALTTMAVHKGYALAMVCKLLGAALAEMAAGRAGTTGGLAGPGPQSALMCATYF